jgi:ParB-like nuclease domain
MPALNPTQHETLQVVPSGQLRRLDSEDIKPSTNNPRVLFDPPQLADLKKNIAEHGVLVPITVFQPKGQVKYSILDGERRYRCVVPKTGINDPPSTGPQRGRVYPPLILPTQR